MIVAHIGPVFAEGLVGLHLTNWPDWSNPRRYSRRYHSSGVYCPARRTVGQ